MTTSPRVLDKTKKLRGEIKKRKQCSYHLEELHGTFPILTVVGLNLPLRRKGQELYDDPYANESTQESRLVSKRHTRK